MLVLFFSEVKKRLFVWENFGNRHKPGENEPSYKRKKSTDLSFQLVRRKLTNFRQLKHRRIFSTKKRNRVLREQKLLRNSLGISASFGFYDWSQCFRDELKKKDNFNDAMMNCCWILLGISPNHLPRYNKSRISEFDLEMKKL